ncbi:MAG: hypothetical protein AAB177_02620, partial [Nitrospirota bacterium]
SCAPLLATTIVAFWTPERIVVAADSKGRVGGVRGKAVVSTCKIVPISNYFYALSGLAQEPETRFDAHRLIVEGMSGNLLKLRY